MAVDTTFLGKIDPNVNEQLMTAQQQLALAQALRGQSLQPIQAPGGQNGRISPLSAIAQALNAYGSKGMMQDATHNLATAQSAQAQAWSNMLRAANSEDGPPPAQLPQQPPQPQQPAPTAPLSGIPQASFPGSGAPQQPSQGPSAPVADASPSNVPSPVDGSAEAAQARSLRQRGSALEMLGQAEKAKALYDQAGQIEARIRDRNMPAPTDTEKMLLAQGIQRGTPAWNQAMASAVTKANYIAPVQVAQGNVALDPATNKPVLQNPKMADGMAANFTNPLAPTASAVPGYAEGNAANVGAAEKAKADAAIRDVTLPTGETVPVRAGPAAAAGGTQAGIGPTWTGGALSGADLSRLQAGAAAGDANSKAVLSAYQQAQPRLGQPTGAKESVEGMSKKWEDLAANNGSSQQAISFLSNIKQLADKAITGTASDKIAFANGLLAQTGISDRATDAQTATDLLNKNSSRITALLGQGSLGTDAARQVLAAANPNAKMSKDAIKEAADDIIGQYRMTQSKANVLLSYRNANDAQGYNTAETKFNQVADPRVWRLQSMAPQDAAAYIKRMAPADAADLLRKRTEIMKNGWLQ